MEEAKVYTGGEFVRLRAVDIKAAYEAADNNMKKVLIKMAPDVLGRGFRSGTWFFKKWDHDPVLQPMITKDTVITEPDLRRIYVLGHLQGSKEYGLFCLSTGYQFRRGDVYRRDQRLGVVIPPDVLQYFHVIREPEAK